jgi:hypothetical protein
MSLTLQPVRVRNGADEEGLLIHDQDHRFVAVVTHLGEQYDGVSGHWSLEAGFGQLHSPNLFQSGFRSRVDQPAA